MKGQISQRDLARLAGVSPMTVSLALRGHPSIPAETRTRIEKLAGEHHYRPDPALAALNAWRIRQAPTRFQGTLAWVTRFDTRDAWRDMIQAKGYHEGACARADQLGYRMEEFWVNEPGLTAKRATQILLARGVRGLVIAPLPEAHGRIDLEWGHFSAVALGYSLAEPKLHVVMNHQFRNMKQVVERLHGLGYRRIGFAMPSANDERVDHNYLGGFWIAQQALARDGDGGGGGGGAGGQMPTLLAAEFDRETFVPWFREARPDAIVVAASTARRVREWLGEEGVRVPQDAGLAVASVPWKDTTISGIDEDVPAIGAHAVETVVGMIHRNEQGVPSRPLSLLVEGIWRAGKTVRKVRAGREAAALAVSAALAAEVPAVALPSS
ncbi:MAG: LacI family transcriptional regulator [Opitutaceae bacterium]|nr:LacI family transcriptional regulator [Opitutaceae bacterium]